MLFTPQIGTRSDGDLTGDANADVVELDDPREDDRGDVLWLAAHFDAGRMDGILERYTPAQSDPEELEGDPVRGHFPSTCEGVAQRPLSEAVFGLSPAAVLERLQDLGPEVELDWGDGRRVPLEMTLTPASETACHVAFETEDSGRAMFRLSLTLSTPQGGVVATATLDATLAFAPRTCGSPPRAGCSGPAVHALSAITGTLSVESPERLLGEDGAEGVGDVAVRLGFAEGPEGWRRELRLSSGAESASDARASRVSE